MKYKIISIKEILFFMTVVLTQELEGNTLLEVYSYEDKIYDWVREFKLRHQGLTWQERIGNQPIELIENFVLSKLEEIETLKLED